MDMKILFFLFLIIFTIGSIEGGRSFGGRFSGGRGSSGGSRGGGGRTGGGSRGGHTSSGGGHTSSGSTHTSSGSTHTSSGSTHTSSGSTHTSSGNTHTSSGSTHTSSTNGGHTSLSSSSGGSNKPNTGGHNEHMSGTNKQNPNQIFLQAEGGGASRPTGNNKPSAPPAPHPHESVQKSTVPLQTQGNSKNLEWANPHLTGSSNPNTNPQNTYPVQPGTRQYPVQPGTRQYPVQPGVPPYPVQPGVPPYPVQPGVPPYPVYPNHPHPNKNTEEIGWKSSVTQPNHSPYPSNNYPNRYPGQQPGHPHPVGNPYPIRNPYPSQTTGNFSNMPTAPVYQQPHVLAQPAAQPYIPGQTILMVPQERNSLGDMVKQALVFSAVHTITDRVLFPHHSQSVETRPGTTTNTVIYNQYFNGTAPVSGTPQASPLPSGTPSNPSSGSPSLPTQTGGSSIPAGTPVHGTNNVNPGIQTSNVNVNTNQGNGNTPNDITSNAIPQFQYSVSDDELRRISEELFANDEPDLTKYVAIDLQNRSSVNFTDVAKRRLFYVARETYDIPTIYATRALFDNYENNSTKKEDVTVEKRKEQNLLLDLFVSTHVMSRAMHWLARQSFIDPDDFERKDVLKNIWFTQFAGTTSGFERVFTSEIYGNVDILGIQDWLYFDYAESSKQIDYLGYVDKLDFGDRASLVKLNLKMNDIVRPNVTIFVGTTPELEMALYTICFYARPNTACPVAFGGKRFVIYTHSFRYYGKDVIDVAMPIF